MFFIVENVHIMKEAVGHDDIKHFEISVGVSDVYIMKWE
jgi:hypothetical protein